MVSERSSSRALAAVVTGVSTAAYYATPDFIASRTARGWAKAGLTALSAAASVPEMRASWAEVRERQREPGELSASEVVAALPIRSKALLSALAAAVLAGSVGALVLAERRVHRHGQARAASGKRLPHTGPALLYGALAGGLWLLPTPTDAP